MNIMSKDEALDLFIQVRHDYVGMARDCHALRRAIEKPPRQNPNEFDPDKLPLVAHMDKGIRDLRIATGRDKHPMD